ncbi:MAG: DEAD/DEAH box helicase, partial [Chloroflexi bacterium]|nr:DEAD/DEAH box helicase [Chloroflexota bacterium]
MNLSALLPALRTLPEYPGLLEHIGRNPVALGLPRAARLPLVAALAADLQRPALLIAARSDRALLFNEELPAWLPSTQHSHSASLRGLSSALGTQHSTLAGTIHHFPEPNPLPYEHAPWGPRTIRQRIETLAALTSPRPADSSFIITSARALLTRTLPKRDYLAAARTLRIGQSIRLDKLLESWIGAGYTSDTIVSEPGQFSRRGGIVDVWPPADTYPTRIELFGDEIEHLRRFDPASQRSGDGVDSVTVTPAREVLIKNGPRAVQTQHIVETQHAASLPDNIAPDLDRLAEGATFPTLEFYLPLLHTTPASLLDYLPDDTLIFIDDWSDLAGTVAELETQALELRADALNNGLIAPDFPAPNLSWSDLQDDLAHLPLIHLGHLADELITALPISLGDHFTPGPRFGGQVDHILDHLITRHTAPDAPTLLVTRQAARMAELWGEHDAYLPPTEHLPDPLPPLAFVQGALSDGFTLRLPTATLSLLTDSELFGWARPEPRRRPHTPEPPRAPDVSYADFAPGDYIVHVDYGIGRYTGLVKRTLDGHDREYIHLQYEGGDDLYVPIIQADRLSKYIGANETPPGLSRLGTAEWVAARTRAQQAAEEVARELLDLYAKRETIPGRAFAPDTVWQGELEAAFGYIETPDQLKAIDDVKRDMEHARPMDRLICGDVGYGKTEVALRAAFKAVNDGAQVAVLVPTTVLAQQHFNTFRQRLAAYPVKVEMLSRFRTHAEQEEILRNTHSGEVDILIGTHRLIQKDVAFANLGLLVIDEEQRFGVTHKERPKQMRTEVDVLTLTATPIPRTLQMSLSGIRDLSVINTPPVDRQAIKTYLTP